ncbi:hypothetical protein A3A76_02420 [Candidatus Woesebacteria bacterium RIFCSPLOWO2_01_FULL_39_23]|uniref:Uncharacterized protein n=1 Tax=Candidatus Woesebacteria bacterium RIFCSPHIGHO2_01_FULL_40_22 TaxID=1802499 RepID=A0A1F7YJ09_9BACT|nr:MAG: hypothetical protein A2141_01610 [Candidatus Woesebacteria bacterium RBG_16_40_11]OGM27331.1 MAG: hypothetical protein A2628_00825 [Candidatus Woesebacteria bacterium RIFCSPHIGHO2_01_FULL_40_22]OGM36972.1 MAG: hypothetical protein A3E41_05865 [Candidatus Woesebacteria bacterium RIFCSPHIGHO2_12_FULL_38_9]OGM62503.1 MAG: hypothetical protein A3A76_02420 [Candidatus Woesebacteria bacterium RIFCSPLOWO2_01_FULL_39_23]
MLETPHVIVGAVIASKVGNPYLAIPLAFISHFVLEKVPHWNPHLNVETVKFGKVTSQSFRLVLLDSFIALISGLTIASWSLPNATQALTIIGASFFAVLPDLVEAPYFFLNWKNNLIKKWIGFQKSLQVDTTPAWGLLTQTITILTALWWLRA